MEFLFVWFRFVYFRRVIDLMAQSIAPIYWPDLLSQPNGHDRFRLTYGLDVRENVGDCRREEASPSNHLGENDVNMILSVIRYW